MQKRKIIKIHEEKCNGCGICVNACHEKAIEIIDGKAKLVSDIYCDGLGDCLPSCPMDAIEIIEREAKEYSQSAVDERIKGMGVKSEGGCVSSKAIDLTKLSELKDKAILNMANEKLKEMAEVMSKKTGLTDINISGHVHEHGKGHGLGHHEGGCSCNSGGQKKQFVFNETPNSTEGKIGSELRQWPVQIKLMNSRAEYLNGADILIAADCTAYAYGDFHRDFVKGRVTMIGCPKLDDNQYYIEKLAEIFSINEIKSITVVRMEVPCCSGITQATRTALELSGKEIPYEEINISVSGVRT